MAIANFDKLTDVQQGLLTGLAKEFTKINPKPSKDGKRFGLGTISQCLKEEERFHETIKKHNMTMMKLFVGQFENDIKEFKKEFGKAIDIKLGSEYSESKTPCETPKQLMERNAAATRSDLIEAKETKLFFVSKCLAYSDDSRYNYFGYKYHKVYVDFKREKVSTTLESGKVIAAYKIIGLQYNTESWLCRKEERNQSFSTLDELIQRHQPTQQKLVQLTK
jgi:hypothetical protein